MGWNSASEIFDPVADALLSSGVDDEDITTILDVLIDVLQDQDWDTEDESLLRYRDSPAVVAAFAANGITLPGKRCPHCDGILEDDCR